MDAYLADSLAIERGEPREIVVIFDEVQASYIRGRVWHHSQVLEELRGGKLRMTVTIGGLGELKRWILSMGCHAEVLEPSELRESVKGELKAASALYGLLLVRREGEST